MEVENTYWAALKIARIGSFFRIKNSPTVPVIAINRTVKGAPKRRTDVRSGRKIIEDVELELRPTFLESAKDSDARANDRSAPHPAISFQPGNAGSLNAKKSPDQSWSRNAPKARIAMDPT
jgi:hypothetical protein